MTHKPFCRPKDLHFFDPSNYHSKQNNFFFHYNSPKQNFHQSYLPSISNIFSQKTMLTSPVHDDTTISSASATVSSTMLEVGEGEARVSVDMEVETNMYNVHTSFSSSTKPHATSSDPCWNIMQSEVSSLSLDDFCFIRKLGSGDIGSVYLVELKGNNKGCLFAAKVMDKEELVSRSKEGRAGTEREILEMLDHPFLPTLYTTLDTDKWSLLLTEFCPGGDLHVLRQRLPEKRFDEAAVRLVVYFSLYLYVFSV